MRTAKQRTAHSNFSSSPVVRGRISSSHAIDSRVFRKEDSEQSVAPETSLVAESVIVNLPFGPGVMPLLAVIVVNLNRRESTVVTAYNASAVLVHKSHHVTQTHKPFSLPSQVTTDVSVLNPVIRALLIPISICPVMGGYLLWVVRVPSVHLHRLGLKRFFTRSSFIRGQLIQATLLNSISFPFAAMWLESHGICQLPNAHNNAFNRSREAGVIGVGASTVAARLTRALCDQLAGVFLDDLQQITQNG